MVVLQNKSLKIVCEEYEGLKELETDNHFENPSSLHR
jgi:hypothetical protein